jgi:ligand-binding sensor domain-containing protein/signal transduction histidine kinase
MRSLASSVNWATRGLLLLPLSVCSVHGERLPTTAYTTSDGLPHGVVKRVVPDSRGFVWFCTRLGLSRFDGERFLNYGVAQGLPIPSVNDLLETSRGEYWVATNGGGVCRLNTVAGRKTGRDSSRFTDCVQGETPEASRVNRLYEDRTGRIWAGTDGGLFRLVGTTGRTSLERIALGLDRPDRAVHVWSFAEESNGTLWIGTSDGLARRISDSHTIQYRIQPLRGADHVYALLLDRQNRIWIGHGTGLIVFRYDEPGSRGSARVRQMPLKPGSSSGTRPLPDVAGEAIRFTTTDGLAGQAVLALHRSSDQEVWLGTSGGVSQFDGGRISSLTTGRGVLHVSAIAEDQGRHIWAGTETGAVRLARTGFVRYTETDGLLNGVIRSVFEDRAGVLHVVTRRPLIHRFDGTRFTAVRPNLSRDELAPESAVPALQDRAGEWWVPGEAGLYRLPRVATHEQLSRVRPKAIYTSRDGLAGDDIFRLFEDSRGDIWIARRTPTRSVLTRWDRATETFHRYFDSDGLPAFSRPLAFAEDRTGSVWVGFWGGGIARYHNGLFTRFTSADGAPAGSITAIYSDASGRLWIGSSGEGVRRIDDVNARRPRFVPYTTTDGLASDYIHSITEDRSGHIYFGTFSGVDRLDPFNGQVRHYALPGEMAATEVDVAFCDRRGTLWFGTQHGLTSLIPAPDTPGTPPVILIGGLSVAGEIYPVSELGNTAIPAIELEAHQNQLQVDFFSISAVSPVRYQYKLEGADRDWSAPTAQRSVTFASLSPGRYRFAVRAISADGLMSAAPASVAFHIAPPVWLRWWFLTGMVVPVALAAYGLHRIRLVRLLELERVRMRIATDLHDDIGSSLTQIAILSEVAERRMKGPDPAVSEPISRVSVISRELVDSMSEIVWAINPRNDRLQDLASRMRRFAADMLAGRPIALRFRAPDDEHGVSIGADFRRQVFLIFKEAVHNAVRHSECTELQVEIGLQNRRLVLSVSDNGRGFDARQPADGNGRRSIESRANGLGGRVEIVSAPGRGTTVRVVVPLSRRTVLAPKAS